MNDARILAMMTDACFGLRSDDEFRSDLRGYLARHGLSPADVEAMVDAPPRLAVYRRLIRNNLTDVTSKMMPRTRARMNALADGAFDASFDEFLATASPRTPYLRDVPHEFFEWAAPRWRVRDDVPAYVVCLAEHELMEFALAAFPTSETPTLDDVTLDRPLVFREAMRIVHYPFAIHELSLDADDRTPPPERPTDLLAYRDVEHRVRYLELTPLAATLVRTLVSGLPLEAGLKSACAAHDAKLDDAVLGAIARLLAELGERGVLLGSRAAATG